jgi:hypothetical protein
VTRLNNEPEIIRMASELGLSGSPDPTGDIVKFCVTKIQRWLAEAPPVSSIAQLEHLVCDRLQLRFEEFRSDAELAEIVERYTRLGDPVFRKLLDDFDEQTFATLLHRTAASETAADRYVAVVDCRGPKASKRYFSRWHEIAHLLTMRRQLELPYHRSTKKPPLERLMDHIAGEVGFFSPLFRSALEQFVGARSHLTFGVVDDVRQEFCPAASFHSTLIACVRHARSPIIHLEVGMGLKTAEQKSLASGQGHLFSATVPEPKLRALVVARNDSAREGGFRIDRNMAVPPSSVIAALFQEVHRLRQDVEAVEKLEMWRHSNGIPVGSGSVRVEARLVNQRALAIIQPLGMPRARRGFIAGAA